MPDIERRGRHQKAVYWAYASRDRHGRSQVSSAVEVTVRWESVVREIAGEDGTPVGIDVTVWTDRTMAAGSILWLGAYADLPASPTNLQQVVTTEEVPDIKGRIIQYAVLLKNYGDALPTVV